MLALRAYESHLGFFASIQWWFLKRKKTVLKKDMQKLVEGDRNALHFVDVVFAYLNQEDLEKIEAHKAQQRKANRPHLRIVK